MNLTQQEYDGYLKAKDARAQVGLSFIQDEDFCTYISVDEKGNYVYTADKIVITDPKENISDGGKIVIQLKAYMEFTGKTLDELLK